MANERVKPAVKPAKEAKKPETEEVTDDELEAVEDGEGLEADDQSEDESDESDAESSEDEGSADDQQEEQGEPEVVVQPAEKTAQAKLNEPVKGVKSGVIPDAGDAPKADENEMSDLILDTPQNFGIHINGALHAFRKGRTRLTKLQAEHCTTHPYVRDNGAAIYRIKPKAKK